MPLALASPGETMLVIRITSPDAKLRKRLEDIGIVSGAELTPLSYYNGNMIVRVHDSRIALNGEIARNIIVGKRSV